MKAAAELNWAKDNETKKYIFHIFDAPPHGKQFKGTGDKYPNGCPCNNNHYQIIRKINKESIDYVICALTPRVNTTLEIFEKAGLLFDKFDIEKEKT